jgi:6-pyruvoyltetrahydropterin/6-carboxytetrahydropterin synthase
MFELKIVTRFAAAHQLKMVSQKCENLHGHNWKVEVRVAGKKLNSAGVLVDFGELKKHVAELINELDHRFLNDTDFFGENTPPSSENIAFFIAKGLEKKLDGIGAEVTRVSAWESDDACATYINDNP